MILYRRFVPFIAIAGIALCGACSHEQKPPTATPAVAAARNPAPPPSPRRQMAEASQLSRTPAPAKADPAVFFDFDSAVLRDESHATLQKVSSNVHGRSDEKLRIEGNCDELGTVEYNLALGEHRARAAKTYLVHLGVPKDRITTISYGSQRPKYPGSDDDSRAKNRRDDFIVIR